MITKNYNIVGMHCASCKIAIEKKVAQNSHVHEVSVNYGAEQMTITYDDDHITESDIKALISQAGNYRLARYDHEDISSKQKMEDIDRAWRELTWVFLASIPFILDMIIMVGDRFFQTQLMPEILMTYHIFPDITLHRSIQIILSSFILFYGGRSFYRGAWQALKSKTSNMDTLVVMGTTAAWVYSFVSIVFLQKGDDAIVYFEAAVFITLFVLIGRYVEKRSRMATRHSVEKLIAMQAKDAVVIRNGEELIVSIEDLNINDRVVIKPGQKIPVDGIIVQGEVSIDESMITGEAIPVDRAYGDKVVGGTINLSGTCIVRVTHVGDDTLLAQIIALVRDAQGTDVPIQRLVDAVSQYFVPAVLIIAGSTFVFWWGIAPHVGLIGQEDHLQFAFYTMISVLVIACPCALGLATPTAIVVAIGTASQKGILIKDAQSLENARRIAHMIFDKTGTVTQGHPSVMDTIFYGDKDEGMMFAYMVEKRSDHPIAQAIVRYLKKYIMDIDRTMSVYDFSNMNGSGVRGSINKHNIRIEKYDMSIHNTMFSKEQSEAIASHISSGHTMAILTIDDRIRGFFAIEDHIKESSIMAIAALHGLKIETTMVTGDHERVAQNVAHEVGIDHVRSNVLPAQKESIVQEIKKSLTEEGLVAVAGDGINDAPALARSDIGIAMGTGTDVAIEAGDVVIVHGSLQKIVTLIHLSHKTMRIIKQNLFWAFAYNIIAIPIACGVLYPIYGIALSPMIASAAMAFSSVSVVLNSLRLRT